MLDHLLIYIKLVDSVAVVGHNRYSTAGMKNAINCVQPFVLYTAAGIIAIAHNGELVNAGKSRDKILRSGVGLSTDTDSELIGQIISKTIAQNMKCRGSDMEISGDINKELAAAMSAVDLSYALVVMTYDRIYAIRDPYGNRPLCIGTLYGSQKQINGKVNRLELSKITQNIEVFIYEFFIFIFFLNLT